MGSRVEKGKEGWVVRVWRREAWRACMLVVVGADDFEGEEEEGKVEVVVEVGIEACCC